MGSYVFQKPAFPARDIGNGSPSVWEAAEPPFVSSTGHKGTHETLTQREDSDPVPQRGDTADKPTQGSWQLAFCRKSTKSLLTIQPEQGAGAQDSSCLMEPAHHTSQAGSENGPASHAGEVLLCNVWPQVDLAAKTSKLPNYSCGFLQLDFLLSVLPDPLHMVHQGTP